MVRVKHILNAGVVYVVVIGIAGCGSGTTVKQLPASVFQLKLIAQAYAQATESLERPPNNKQEILEFLKDKGYDNPEDILRSKVDGEEFVIHWGVDYRNVGPGSRPATLPVLAYEKVGKDGKRQVLQFRYVSQVADEDLASLPFPKPYKAP
jgi:hypothetical protein